MKALLIYFLLFAFWAENVYRISFSDIRGFSLTNMSMYFVLVAWLLEAGRRHKLFLSNNLHTPIVLTTFMAFTSILIKLVIGEIPTSLLKESLDLINWSIPLLVFLAVFNTLNKESTCYLSLAGLLVLLAATTITPLVAALGNIELPGVRSAGWRIGGFGNVNVYAVYLVMFMPLLFSLGLLGQRSWIRGAAWVLFAVSMISLLRTGSRSGVISFVFAMFTYLIIVRKMYPTRLIIVGIVSLSIIASVAVVALPSQVKGVFAERLNPQGAEDVYEYTSGRTQIWKNGLLLFLDSPIYGHGQNTFLPLNTKRFQLGFSAHNAYLTYMVEQGLIGLSIFVFLLSRIFSHLLRQLRSSPNRFALLVYAGYLAGFCGYAVAMLAGNVATPRYIFWIYTAVVYKLTYITTESNSSVASALDAGQ
ncbi:MAG: O-antigen ligase family protein [Deferrisomatales bacterium]|nr:O-antigen ligase family protein [Deferrisomatales bacterium]